MAETEYHARGNGNTLQQDLWRVEDELKELIRETKRDLQSWHRDHTEEHQLLLADLTVRRSDVDRRVTAIQEAYNGIELERAKRAGALGVFTYLVKLLSDNWKLLAVIAMALLAFLNRIHISFT